MAHLVHNVQVLKKIHDQSDSEPAAAIRLLIAEALPPSPTCTQVLKKAFSCCPIIVLVSLGTSACSRSTQSNLFAKWAVAVFSLANVLIG